MATAENVLNFTHTWEVDFQEITNCDDGKSLLSDTFRCSFKQASFVFQLEMIPNGKTHTGQGIFELFVRYVDGPSDNLVAKVWAFLLQVNDSKPSVYGFERVEAEFKKVGGDAIGTDHRFMPNDAKSFQYRVHLGITTDEQAIHSRIKVKCVITIAAPFFDFKPHVPPLEPEKRIGGLLDAVIDATLPNPFSDVRLISEEGVKFRCHKVILSKFAPIFFEQLFESKLEESCDKVIFKTISGEVLAEILRFIYLNQIGDNLKRLAAPILNVAEMYQLDNLKRYCEACLFKDVDISNAVEMVGIGDLFKLKDLKEKAISVLVENFEKVMNEQEWFDLLMNKPKLANEIMLHSVQRMKVEVALPANV